jgi:transcriptional regulator
MREPVTVLPGTLDLLILKAVSLGAQHGYGVLLRIQQMSRDGLLIEQGALYPALYRLEHQGLIDAEWGQSDNNRRAKFYTLTAAGKGRLAEDLDRWNRLVDAMSLVLSRRTVEAS